MAKMSVEKSIWTTIWKGIFCICTAWKMFIFEVHDFYSKTHSFKVQARLQFSDSFYVLFFCVVKHFLRQLHKRKFPCERDPSDVAYAAPKICSTFDDFHFLNFLGSLCHSWQFLQSLCESWSLMTQTAKIIDFYSLFNQLYIHPELALDTRSYQCWLAGPDCNSLKCRRCELDFKCLYSPHHVSKQSIYLTSV